MTLTTAPSALGPDCDKLIAVFNDCFAANEHTLLVGGAAEPFYQAWQGTSPARIYFTRDYRSSALHEIAHWTIAGPERRQQDDYGYWYVPDGRNASQQAAFERVEVRPQAVEWALHLACGWRFRLSADNLSQDTGSSANFAQAVCQHAQTAAANHSWPPRALILLRALGSAKHHYSQAFAPEQLEL